VTPRRPGLRARAVNAAARAVNRAGYELTRDRFKHRFLHALDQHGVRTVLDIGANVGQFGATMRRGGFTGRIVSVEPLGDAFDELRARAAADGNWSAERAAVSDRPGSLTMNVSQNSVSSSALPILERSTTAAPQTAYVATEEVAATTVDDLVARHGIDPATALLKIDVQGYEAAVLAGAADTLERFAAVRTEMTLVPLYEGQSLLPEMIEFFGRHGFDLWYVEPGWVEPGTQRLLQLDGVFFRADTRTGS
jgi:FkbM family methyltransferase